MSANELTLRANDNWPAEEPLKDSTLGDVSSLRLSQDFPAMVEIAKKDGSYQRARERWNNMSGLKTTWGDEDKKEFKALPNGVYHATVSGAQLTKSKDNTEDVVEFEFTVTDSDHANRKLWDKCNVQKVAWKVKKNFTALGVWPENEPDSIDELLPLCGQALNKSVEVKVTTREYNGKFYNNAEVVKVIDTADQDIPF